MTVRDWVQARLTGAPRLLGEQVLAALGPDAEAAESQTSSACLDAAVRLLDTLLAERRFARESALDLLTVDALMTYAFEYAGAAGFTTAETDTFARRGAEMAGRLANQRV